MSDRRTRLPRPLHPIAWWAWALGLATAASRTTNLVLLALIVAVAALVVAARRTEAPWARSFRSYLVLGLIIVALRVVFYLALGRRFGSNELITLPELALPDWAAGIRLGGPVTAEGLLTAMADGARLATILICVGAANTLANPRRLLRCVPTALYEIGTTVVIALSIAPQLSESVQRVRRARQLRARPERGLRAVRAIALPVVADALDRSMHLAAAMDSRGFGRRPPPAPNRAGRFAAFDVTTTIVLAGLVGVCVGLYGLLDGTAPPMLGLPMLAIGLAFGVGGLMVARQRIRPTVYRPDVWRVEEWLVLACGATTAAAFIGLIDIDALNPATDPPTWPAVPAIAIVALAVAALPAWLAPPQERAA